MLSYPPKAVPMHAVEGLGKVYKIHIERALPLVTLFDNVSKGEDVFDTTSSSPETCLFLAKLKIHSQ